MSHVPYLPATDDDRKEMLAAIGVDSVEGLFRDVPDSIRFPEIKLPEPLSEMEMIAEMASMAEENVDTNHAACFLGAGAYHHFVPSVVPFLQSRSEFITAYTPYQPEVSQGTLQAMFEYQSMVAEITGMEVVNASHYDGATSLAESAVMSINVSRGKRKKIVVDPAIHPQHRVTLRTYLPGCVCETVGDEDLTNRLDDVKGMIDGSTACVIVQNPNFFGEMIDPDGMKSLEKAAHDAGALLVVMADPISLGLFTPPGEYGADIVVGEGQPLGAPLNFGGPYLGIFATLDKYKRQMPGRLVGQTVDTKGRRGYVLTLSTREQHIRREKATSNICTNQGLIALGAAIYLAAMGRQGLRTVAEHCYHKAHYAAKKLDALAGYELAAKGVFFKEFALKCPRPVSEINAALLEKGIIGGYDLSRDYPHRKNEMLLCFTEMNTRAQIDALAEALKEVA